MKVSPTGIKEDTLTHIGKKFSSPPPNAAEFVVHKGKKNFLMVLIYIKYIIYIEIILNNTKYINIK